MLWTYAYLPVTLSRIVFLGKRVPTSLYWATGFAIPAPGLSCGVAIYEDAA